MYELNMKPIDKALYLQYEAEILKKVKWGQITMYRAAELLDNYLKCLGY